MGGTAGTAPVEAVEDQLALRGHHPGAVVLHAEAHQAVDAVEADADLAVAVLEGVLHQVRHHPAEAALVCGEHGVLCAGGGLEVDLGG